jgi:hypothetical protein
MEHRYEKSSEMMKGGDDYLSGVRKSRRPAARAAGTRHPHPRSRMTASSLSAWAEGGRFLERRGNPMMRGLRT